MWAGVLILPPNSCKTLAVSHPFWAFNPPCVKTGLRTWHSSANLEKHSIFSLEVKQKCTMWPSNSTLGWPSRRDENIHARTRTRQFSAAPFTIAKHGNAHPRWTEGPSVAHLRSKKKQAFMYDSLGEALKCYSKAKKPIAQDHVSLDLM